MPHRLMEDVPVAPSRNGPAASPTISAVVYPDNLAALGVCRALGARGVPVTVVAGEAVGPGQYSRHAGRVLRVPRDDEGALVAALRDFGRGQAERPVLFLTDDPSLVALHRHRAVLEPVYRFPSAPWGVLRRLMLKDELYAALEGVVPVPRTRVPGREDELAEIASDLGYPLLVKPRLRCLHGPEDGALPPFEKYFGAKAARARTRDELTRVYAAARSHGFPVVVQEEIPGASTALFSLGLYATAQGKVVAAFTSQKLCQVPADFGDGLVVRATRVPELIPLGERVVRRFGYHGMADLEFKWDPRDHTFKLLDVNPRPWLWINLPTACGVNLPYAAYLDALGRPLDPREFVQREDEIRWTSLRGLLVYAIRSLRGGRPLADLLAVLRVLASPRGRRVGPVLSREDPLVGMFVSPRYWHGALRGAIGGLRRLRVLGQGR